MDFNRVALAAYVDYMAHAVDHTPGPGQVSEVHGGDMVLTKRSWTVAANYIVEGLPY